MATRVLISAGEASGDLYAAGLVEALRRRNPDIEFFGCAGPRMQRAGVRAVVDAAHEQFGTVPSIELGLVTLARALGMPNRSAGGLFANLAD